MPRASLLFVFALSALAPAADLESRALTHYIPQDQLEGIVRKEGWHEIGLKPFGGVHKGDKARIWAGGVIDRGGTDQPGKIFAGPAGPEGKVTVDGAKLTLSSDPVHAYAILFKTEDGVV